MLDKPKFNVYNLKTEEIIKKTGRDLDYVGTWDIGYGVPTAVFADRKLKAPHKLFLLITMNEGQELREDKDWVDLENARRVVGARCDVCSEIIYSPGFTHPSHCKCGMVKIEGGTRRPTIFGPGKVIEIDMTSKFRGKRQDEA